MFKNIWILQWLICSQAPKYFIYGEGSTTIPMSGSTLQAYGNGNSVNPSVKSRVKT